MSVKQVFSYLLDSLVHPQKKLPSGGIWKRAVMLIAAIILTEDNKLEGESKRKLVTAELLNSLVTSLTSACSVYDEILSMEFAGGVLLDRCESFVSLISKHAVISLCVLRHLICSLSDNAFVSSPSYATLCPILLQIVVTVVELYPKQHPDCFMILRMMHEHKAKFEDADSGRTLEIVSVKRDIIDCVIYMIGCGYIYAPLEFLSTGVLVADAAVARHIIFSCFECFVPPFDVFFSTKVSEIILSVANRKALSSVHFTEKGGPELLKKFYDDVKSLTGIDESLVARLAAVVASL